MAGECEDHVQVARGEQFSLTRGDPPFPSRDLTLWTVTITAANGEISVSCIGLNRYAVCGSAAVTSA